MALTVLAGQIILADDHNALVPLFAYKSADEPRVNNTYDADDHLTLNYAAGMHYELGLWLPMEGPTAADFKMRFTFTASSVDSLDYSLDGPTIASTTADTASRSTAQLAASTSPSAECSIGTITSNWVPGEVEGRLITLTAGTLTLEWAQVNTNATPVIVKKGSFMELIPRLRP